MNIDEVDDEEDDDIDNEVKDENGQTVLKDYLRQNHFDEKQFEDDENRWSPVKYKSKKIIMPIEMSNFKDSKVSFNPENSQFQFKQSSFSDLHSVPKNRNFAGIRSCGKPQLASLNTNVGKEKKYKFTQSGDISISHEEKLKTHAIKIHSGGFAAMYMMKGLIFSSLRSINLHKSNCSRGKSIEGNMVSTKGIWENYTSKTSMFPQDIELQLLKKGSMNIGETSHNSSEAYYHNNPPSKN